MKQIFEILHWKTSAHPPYSAAMYKCKHFKIQELVPQAVFEQHGGSELLWLLFDPLILHAVDLARGRYGKMLANTWAFGGGDEYRGFRPWDCAVGASLSQHKFGRAVDLLPQDATAAEIREDILAGRAPEIADLITCLEMDISWLHMDRGNRAVDPDTGLQLVYP